MAAITVPTRTIRPQDIKWPRGAAKVSLRRGTAGACSTPATRRAPRTATRGPLWVINEQLQQERQVAEMLGLTTDEIEAHFAENAKRFLAKIRGANA